MVIAFIWLFEEATVNIGYCSSYFKNIWNIRKLVFLVSLLICMNEFLSGKGATNWSRSLLICMNVLAFQFPGAKEPRSQTGLWPWMSECLNVCNISFRVTGLPEVWLFVWMYLFQHFFIVFRSQCESKPSPNILLFLFSPSLLYYQILYKMCHFTCFSPVEACLPGNTVLRLFKLTLTMYTPNVPKVSFSLKDVLTEKLLVVAYNLATPGRKNPPGTCSLWH